MNNKALISLSVIVLFNLTACSSNSRKAQSAQPKPAHTAQSVQTPQKHNPATQAAAKAHSNQQNHYQQQWHAKQRALQAQKEQKRLAYNRNWQNQQRQLAQQKANEQARLAAEAKARQAWQQQQAYNAAAQRSALAQQQYYQRQAEISAQRQAQIAAQQQAQQAAQARQQAQQAAQRAAAQQYAMMQRNQQYTQPHQSRGRSISSLSDSEIRAIGDKIFRNESGGDIDKLVHWNVGENFASMGIGHFTWYPSGRRTRYGNTFPGLLDHLQANGVRLPVWVQKARHAGAPWAYTHRVKLC